MHSCIPSYRELLCDEIADRLGLCAPPAHENCGSSQALCTPMMKLPTVSGSEHFLCIPLTKSAGRLRLCELPTASGSEPFFRTPLPKMAGRLRRFACKR